VKFLSRFALTAALAAAESHPSWWMYASPDATALVGIQGENLRNSPFAAAVDAELSSTGPLAFPDLDCLKHAREILLSSPELLAAEAGSFPAATVKDQAQRAGLHRVAYRGLSLWAPDAAAGLGVAQISEQLVLVGTRKTLQAAIDRSMLESGRQYSGLLPKAARFSQTGDLWVVAVKLPDPLASLFVPLEVAGWGFTGQVSVRGGLFVEASFDASSITAAAAIAANLEEQVQTLPPFARTLRVTADRRSVNLGLRVDSEELAAALQAAPVGIAQAPVAKTPAPVAIAPAPAAPPLAKVDAAKADRPKVDPPQAKVDPAQPVAASVETKPVEERPMETRETEPKPQPLPPPPAPPEPQVIRIIGLDDGPREIKLPPLPSN
jgi:hypothetical protein